MNSIYDTVLQSINPTLMEILEALNREKDIVRIENEEKIKWRMTKVSN